VLLYFLLVLFVFTNYCIFVLPLMVKYSYIWHNNRRPCFFYLNDYQFLHGPIFLKFIFSEILLLYANFLSLRFCKCYIIIIVIVNSRRPLSRWICTVAISSFILDAGLFSKSVRKCESRQTLTAELKCFRTRWSPQSATPSARAFSGSAFHARDQSVKTRSPAIAETARFRSDLLN